MITDLLGGEVTSWDEAPQTNNKVFDDVSKCIENLGPEHPFVLFGLPLTESEKDCLHQLQVNSNNSYDHYGNFDSLNDEISAFIEALGNTNDLSDSISQIITKLVEESLKGSGQQFAWVTLRASTETHEFDLPRWHADGRFYESDINQYKIAMALEGHGTLFYDLPEDMREWFNAIENEAADKVIYNDNGTINGDATLEARLESRQILAEKLNDKERIISAKFGQGAVFLVGDDYAAVHSEPQIDRPRLFLSIVPGDKQHIQDLRKNFEEN